MSTSTTSATKPAAKPVNRKRQIILVSLLFIFALALRFNVRQGRIAGDSMEPNYYDGQIVLVWMTAPRARLKPGDAVIVRDKNGDELIKRIAFIRDWKPKSPEGSYPHPNGGRLIPYSILFDDYFKQVATGKKPKPPAENTIYLVGDNMMMSDDSRSFGPVSLDQVLGKVVP